MPIHIIDDDPVIRKVLRAIASLHTNRCAIFESAEKYLAYIHSDTFVEARLIITDVMMPGMSGLELVRTLRSLGLASKIIVISGNFPEHTEAPHPSVCCMMHKPFDIRRMQTIIAIMLVCQCRYSTREQYKAISYWPGIRLKCPHCQSD